MKNLRGCVFSLLKTCICNDCKQIGHLQEFSQRAFQKDTSPSGNQPGYGRWFISEVSPLLIGWEAAIAQIINDFVWVPARQYSTNGGNHALCVCQLEWHFRKSSSSNARDSSTINTSHVLGSYSVLVTELVLGCSLQVRCITSFHLNTTLKIIDI